MSHNNNLYNLQNFFTLYINHNNNLTPPVLIVMYCSFKIHYYGLKSFLALRTLLSSTYTTNQQKFNPNRLITVLLKSPESHLLDCI